LKRERVDKFKNIEPNLIELFKFIRQFYPKLEQEIVYKALLTDKKSKFVQYILEEGEE